MPPRSLVLLQGKEDDDTEPFECPDISTSQVGGRVGQWVGR